VAGYWVPTRFKGPPKYQIKSLKYTGIATKAKDQLRLTGNAEIIDVYSTILVRELITISISISFSTFYFYLVFVLKIIFVLVSVSISVH